jgi:hypothetical protein
VRRPSPARQDRPLRSTSWLRLAVVILAVFFAALPLLLLEGILRSIDPLRTAPPNGRVGDVVYTWGHATERNRFGFRERNFAVPKPEGTFRIMVLGDSITWGIGLPVEERYTNLLEGFLRDSAPALRAEVLNFSIPGIGTFHEAALLHVYQELVDPDLVAVGFCLNDPQPQAMDHSPERESWRPRLAWIQPFFGRIALRATGQRVERAGWQVTELLGLVPRWEEALDRAYDKRSPEWREFVSSLQTIRAISDRGGLPKPHFAVLNQGSRLGAPTDYRNPDETLLGFLRWSQQAEEAARSIGFVAYNHEAEIGALGRRDLSVNRWDGHPSADLHQVYARKMSGMIAREVVPCLRGRSCKDPTDCVCEAVPQD